MVSGNNGDVFVVFNLFTKVDFLVVIGSKALSIFEDQFMSFQLFYHVNTEAKPSRVDKIVPFFEMKVQRWVDKIVPFFEMKVQRCTKKLPKAQNAEK